MIIKEKLYMMAKDHVSEEATRLVEAVEDDNASVRQIDSFKKDFLDVLALGNQITREDYEELSELEFETACEGGDDEDE